MSLSSRLNCRVSLYGKMKTKNALNEIVYDYAELKTLWAEIIPTGGAQQTMPDGSTYTDITHKITVRAASVPNLTNDMYIRFRGQRYDIKYFMPNYKLRDRIEIFCSLMVEA